MTSGFDVAVIGSGFAGSILARTLRRSGLTVALLEKAHHPRFALGESSTPLANLCLERLAARYDLTDLRELATYGRWRRAHPELRRGLKRGFTFYWHRAGEAYSPGEANRARLLVAASPDDETADTHWVRADVDAFLARRAAAEGVELREGFAVTALRRAAGGFELVAAGGGSVSARFVIDATGPGGGPAEALGVRKVEPPARFASRLVYGHFAGVVGLESSAGLEPGPYPDEKAAIHHLLAEGWMYVLPFDHDCVSAGLVLDGGGEAGGEPEPVWERVLRRYPTLRRQFERAVAVRPLAATGPIQHRRRRAAGREGRGAWALLPHTFAFFDPMFSTGITWSLLGVERLAAAFETLAEDPVGSELNRRLDAYDHLLRREAAQIERLLYGATLARPDPGVFAAHSFLYFAAVSHQELRWRLKGDPSDQAEGGFLGAGDPGWESLLAEAVSRLEGIERASGAARTALADGFGRWAARAIEPWNVIGLADPARRNLYPVDLATVRRRGGLLGLSADELNARLHLLRGAAAAPGPV